MVFRCQKMGSERGAESTYIMHAWYEFMLQADRHTEGFRSPVSARAYAYIGLAAWETAVAVGLPSLADRYHGLVLPQPIPNQQYHLPTLLNVCYNTLVQQFFFTMPLHLEKQRQTLSEQLTVPTDPETYRRSADFAKAVAEAVYTWAKTDSLGHQGHLHNFDRSFIPPVGEEKWVPCQDFPTPSLLPYWSKTRAFWVQSDEFPIVPPPSFSLEVTSEFYKQALEIYTLNTPLSEENKTIAEFWNDDLPGITFSSAGRWISILNQIIEQERPQPEKALETYLKMGIVLSDALVACWTAKYHFNILRPETYIRRTFNSAWRPIIHTPPFPAYPSGHSMVGAAAAEVLCAAFGDKYQFTDRSHEGRKEFRSTPRHFNSFRAMAAENAYSRIALGVHFRMDCAEGTRLGELIGKRVGGMPMR